MKEYIKILAIVAYLAIAGTIYIVYQVGYQSAKNEQQPVIVYQVDSAGVEMFGKITDKEIIEGRYTVTAEAYGKFLVTREQYDSINIGDEMPDWLKGRKQ